jgi:hypothetical protein
MNLKRNDKYGFTLVEVLIILAVIFILLRYVFAHEIFEWENGVARSFGIDPLFYRFILGVLWLNCLIVIAVYQRMKRRK